MAKPKTNPHCPVSGCRTDDPHLTSPTVAAMHQYFSKPDELAVWFKSSIVELIQSAIDDVKKGRFFAYLTCWRTPEELYYCALYILFVAANSISCSAELPNSFGHVEGSRSKGLLMKVTRSTPVRSEPRTVYADENQIASAHASFAATDDRVMGKLARNSEFRAPIIDQHIAYLKKRV